MSGIISADSSIFSPLCSFGETLSIAIGFWLVLVFFVWFVLFFLAV